MLSFRGFLLGALQYSSASGDELFDVLRRREILIIGEVHNGEASKVLRKVMQKLSLGDKGSAFLEFFEEDNALARSVTDDVYVAPEKRASAPGRPTREEFHLSSVSTELMSHFMDLMDEDYGNLPGNHLEDLLELEALPLLQGICNYKAFQQLAAGGDAVSDLPPANAKPEKIAALRSAVGVGVGGDPPSGDLSDPEPETNTSGNETLWALCNEYASWKTQAREAFLEEVAKTPEDKRTALENKWSDHEAKELNRLFMTPFLEKFRRSPAVPTQEETVAVASAFDPDHFGIDSRSPEESDAAHHAVLQYARTVGHTVVAEAVERVEKKLLLLFGTLWESEKAEFLAVRNALRKAEGNDADDDANKDEDSNKDEDCVNCKAEGNDADDDANKDEDSNKDEDCVNCLVRMRNLTWLARAAKYLRDSEGADCHHADPGGRIRDRKPLVFIMGSGHVEHFQKRLEQLLHSPQTGAAEGQHERNPKSAIQVVHLYPELPETHELELEHEPELVRDLKVGMSTVMALGLPVKDLKKVVLGWKDLQELSRILAQEDRDIVAKWRTDQFDSGLGYISDESASRGWGRDSEGKHYFDAAEQFALSFSPYMRTDFGLAPIVEYGDMDTFFQNSTNADELQGLLTPCDAKAVAKIFVMLEAWSRVPAQTQCPRSAPRPLLR